MADVNWGGKGREENSVKNYKEKKIVSKCSFLILHLSESPGQFLSKE